MVIYHSESVVSSISLNFKHKQLERGEWARYETLEIIENYWIVFENG